MKTYKQPDENRNPQNPLLNRETDASGETRNWAARNFGSEC